MGRPYIIAIDAVAGGGKTTLSGAVNAALPSSALYCFDDFDEPDIHPVDFYDWWCRGADIAEFDCPGLHQAVSDCIEEHDPDFIVLDMPFGRKHARFRTSINLSIFIDTPLDITLARRILRDYDDLDTVKRELEGYLSKVRALYADHMHFKEACDLILDGTLPAETLRDTVLRHIKETG